MIAMRSPAERLGTFMLVAVGAVLAGLYVAAIGPYWNISPDSATYVGWAQSLAAGRNWDSPLTVPPVTSLVFAAVLALSPGGYVALNAVTKLLIFGALMFAFVLVKRRVGPMLAGLTIVLSLASVHLYYASTQLLSEPAYLFFSMGALLLLDEPTSSHGSEAPDALQSRRGFVLREWLAGALLVAVVMTRTIGVSLPLAVLLVEGKRLAERRRPRLVRVAFALLAISAVVAWEANAGQGYATGWFRSFLLVDPWTPSAGRLALPGLLDRMRDNLRLLRAPGNLLLNSWSSGHRLVDLGLHTAVGATCVAGLCISLWRRVTVDGVYLALYLVVVIAHMLVGGDGDSRFLVPVLPLLFYYGIESACRLFNYFVGARIAGPSLGVVGALYLLGYVGRGMVGASNGVREAHSSPFGEYPIKRTSNYDAERLALWLKAHSRPDERYAAGQRDMFDVISQRRGYDIVPGRTSPPGAFVAWLEHQQVRYLLVDRGGSAVGDSLVAVVRAYPNVFHAVEELPLAGLYQVIPRQDQ